MFEGDSSDTCGGNFPLLLMVGRAEGLTCADLGARTPSALAEFPLLVVLVLLTAVVQNPRRGCRRVSDFCNK
jgi:hypothetical protein